MAFPCTKCGLCCQNITHIKQLSAYHAGDGVCFFYDANTGCTIYENRPDVCKVDEGYIKFFSSQFTQEDYYQKNAQICNQLQEDKKMSSTYRVVL